ncbi:MAG: hypothetical protein KGD59_02215 [Candidatus Heimdallarchaeota archaeon]|nr:hypothetical protein [Candidatus Heimdallarchaeota archaeon]MBY8993336.1 hypothetical protein [Candidatus Heimdallarchaeota archaeon]
MIRENVPLKNFRLAIFPLIIVVELTLSVLFLVMPYFDVEFGALSRGYSIFFGWLLASISLLVVAGAILLLLSAFDLPNSPAREFFHSDKKMQAVGFSVIFIMYLQIVSLSITQLYYALFYPDLTSLYLLIIALSLILPVLLIYMANYEMKPENTYALSHETPTRIKLTAIWLIFITGVMQIFAAEWAFLVIGLIILVGTYFFFFLNRPAVTLMPIILLIHFAFSVLMVVLSFIDLQNLIDTIKDLGYNFGTTQAIIMSVVVLIIPGIISLVLGQSFFRKWLLAWVRSLHPEPEMEITPFDYEEDEEDE